MSRHGNKATSLTASNRPYFSGLDLPYLKGAESGQNYAVATTQGVLDGKRHATRIARRADKAKELGLDPNSGCLQENPHRAWPATPQDSPCRRHRQLEIIECGEAGY